MTRNGRWLAVALVVAAGAGALGAAVIRDDEPVGSGPGGTAPAARRSDVAVTVVDRDGQPAEGALVRASRLDARTYVEAEPATARGRGGYSLSLTAGTWRVTADAAGRQGVAEVRVADGAPAAVEVRLP